LLLIFCLNIFCLNIFKFSSIFITDGDEFQENEKNASITSSEFRIVRAPKTGERRVSRGGILKYNWRLSPMRAKQYLVTRGPTNRGCYARQSTSGARGGDSPSLCALVYPYDLSRGRGREGRGGCIRSLVDVVRRAASSFHTENTLRRIEAQIVYFENN